MLRSIRLKPRKSLMEIRNCVTAPSFDDEPEYEYGTSLRFSSRTLNLLGLEASDFVVGEPVDLACRASVVSVREPLGRDEECSVEMQITHIDVPPADTKSLRDKLKSQLSDSVRE